jgi:hypothetical protein
LRTHPDKEKAKIYDLVIAPYIDHSYETFEMERSLIRNELKRVADFAALSDNPDYTCNVLDEIVNYYGINIFSNEQVG